jgi:hypothetical protein
MSATYVFFIIWLKITPSTFKLELLLSQELTIFLCTHICQMNEEYFIKSKIIKSIA